MKAVVRLTKTSIVRAAFILVTVMCFVGILFEQRQKELSLPVSPGTEKTQEVYLHMTPHELQQDSDYGSVYLTVEQAEAALASTPSDAKAHRTLARSYVNAMYSDKEYLASDVNTP